MLRYLNWLLLNNVTDPFNRPLSDLGFPFPTAKDVFNEQWEKIDPHFSLEKLPQQEVVVVGPYAGLDGLDLDWWLESVK